MKQKVQFLLLLIIISIPPILQREMIPSIGKQSLYSSNIEEYGIFVNESNAYQYEISHTEYSKYVLIESAGYINEKQYAVYVDLPGYVVEIKNIVGDNLTTAIFVNNANLTIITGNIFSNVSSGIVLRNCLENIVENNKITNIIDKGVYIYDSLIRIIKSSIINNEIHIANAGISVSIGIVFIENNKISNCTTAIDVGGWGVIDSKLSNNIINNSKSSIYFGQIQNSIVEKNELYNTNEGIKMTGSSFNTSIIDNIINCDTLLSQKIAADNISMYKIIAGSYGIMLYGGSSDILISNNQIVSDCGISVWKTCKGNGIFSNSILSYTCIDDVGINSTIELNLCKTLDRPKVAENQIVNQISGYPILLFMFMSIISMILIKSRHC